MATGRRQARRKQPCEQAETEIASMISAARGSSADPFKLPWDRSDRATQQGNVPVRDMTNLIQI